MVCCRRFGCGRARVTSRVFDPGLLLGDQALNELGRGQGANGGAPMRKGPKDESLISHASVSRPVTSFSTSRLTFPFGISRALCNQVAQCCLSSLPPSEALRPQSNSMLFVQSCCTNSGLRRPGDFPRGVRVPESPRALSPVSDCSGFVITGYFSLYIR